MLQQPGCLACLVRIAVGVSDEQMRRKRETTACSAGRRSSTCLDISKKGLCAFISHLHGPANRHGSQGRTKPADVLGRAPEHASSL